MPDYQALKAELAKPDLSGLSPAAAATKLNADPAPTVERAVVDAYEVWEAIVPGEWAALAAGEKQRVQSLLGMARVNLKGTNTRASLAAAFAAGTQTRTNLQALQVAPAAPSRAQAIPGWNLPASESDVAFARSLT